MIEHRLHNESNLATMARMADNSVDAIVTDPPYGLGSPPPIVDVLTAWLSGEAYHPGGRGFMGKEWDAFVPGPEIWRECLRVLKPGGHLISFFGTRTYHLGTLAIQMAGFEVRDQLAWIYGSGFPKGQDISKAIDKALGEEREIIGTLPAGSGPMKSGHVNSSGGGMSIGTERSPEIKLTAPSSPLAIKYDGWNTNLKPAMESICLARKPLIGTVSANVMEHGTGGLNIDGCRIGEHGARNNGSKAADDGFQKNDIYGKRAPMERIDYDMGRYPANVITDGSPEVLQFFPSAPGQLAPSRTTPGEKTNSIYGKMNHNSEQMLPRKDESASAARFFYTAKASQKERGDFNDHPTVKPIDLMRWLVRLITPPGGVVYDPFAGSGSTLIAAFQEGFECIGSELDAHYCDIYEKRKLMFPRTQSLL